MNTKICCTCKQEKKKDCFNKSKSSKDGLCRRCKECRSEYYRANAETKKAKVRAYYAANREEILKRRKPYFEARKEIKSEYDKSYRKKNKERIRKRDKEYRDRKGEELLIKKREYYKNNKKRCLKSSAEWQERQSAILSDYYVKSHISKCRSFGHIKFKDIPDWMVKKEKEYLKAYRKLKKLKHEIEKRS